MDNKIIDKLLKFIEKNVTPSIKEDFKWLGKTITKDLEKLTKETSNVYNIPEMINEILREKVSVYILSVHRVNDLKNSKKI